MSSRVQALTFFGAMFLFLSSGWQVVRAQGKKADCGHSPKMVSQPRFSDEDKAKWKGRSVAGTVVLVISEVGDVSQAKVLSASPREAADSLLNAAKQLKFEPRPGCGELKTQVVFNIGN